MSAKVKLLLARVLAIAVMLLGALVIYGWCTENKRLIQITSQLPVMPFNVAFLFVVVGLGNINYLWCGKHYITIGAGIITLLVALVTLSQFILAYDAGVDELS